MIEKQNKTQRVWRTNYQIVLEGECNQDDNKIDVAIFHNQFLIWFLKKK